MMKVTFGAVPYLNYEPFHTYEVEDHVAEEALRNGACRLADPSALPNTGPSSYPDERHESVVPKEPGAGDEPPPERSEEEMAPPPDAPPAGDDAGSEPPAGDAAPAGEESSEEKSDDAPQG